MDTGTPEIRIPGYHVLERIGTGATGTVYAAEDSRTGAKVVVKIIHPHLVRKPNIREAFLQGVTRAIYLDHPGVVPALMTGEADPGGLYVVSGWASGIPLTDLLLKHGAVPEARALDILGGLAGVLGAAHGVDLVHGDLSPENIWISSGEGKPGGVSVTDFGMSPLHMAAGFEDQRPPYYISPEQIRGEAPGVSSDVYALGIIAFQLVTGRLPFSSPRPRDVLLMHLNDDPPPPASLARVSTEMELFLFRSLAKDPALRPSDMGAVQAALFGEQARPSPELREDAPLTMDDMVVVSGTPEQGPARLDLGTTKAAPRKLKERDHAEASGQIETGEHEAIQGLLAREPDPTLVIVEEEEEGELEFKFADDSALIQLVPRGDGPNPAVTGVLPGPRPRPAPDPGPSPGFQILPTVLGLLPGVAVGLVAFRLLTGAWPPPLG